jgi:hypothetical protein
VLHALLFDFLHFATGELTPTRAAIARAANICVRSVDRGLAKLKAAGAIEWTRQFSELTMTQIASAYAVLSQGHWRGYWQAPETPPPYPEAWGACPPLADPIALAGMVRTGRGSRTAILAALACDPHNGLASSLARLGARVFARNPMNC